MKRQKIQFNKLKLLGVLATSCIGYLAFISPHESVEAAKSVATHIGTFEGSTTFTTSSRNGINPGLFIEVMDDEGNLTQYESEEGIITIPDTKEGAYVTQAKLLGKTKYVDQDTGEILDTWEEGRNLRLESVQMPVLTTYTNLFTGFITKGYIQNGEHLGATTDPNLLSDYIEIFAEHLAFRRFKKDGTPVNSFGEFAFYDANKNFIDRRVNKQGVNESVTVPKNTKYIRIWSRPTDDGIDEIAMLIHSNENPSLITTYEPHKSNILTVNEEVELRGIGNVRDELDLITGEVVEKVGIAKLSSMSDEDFGDFSLNGVNGVTPNTSNLNIFKEKFMKYFSKYKDDTQNAMSNFSSVFNTTYSRDYECFALSNHDYQSVQINLSNSRFDGDLTREKAIQIVRELDITIAYELAEKSVKMVDLTSTYFFKPIHKDSIQVTGTITPLVGSITVPTTPVSFVLNPNEEVGQQFIAPEFSVSNDTTAPIRLTLNSFEQTTNVLNDVLPTTYASWEGLNKKESKDIALALVPKVSDGWISLTEGPRYVAEASNHDLGVVKAKSTVDFTFSALHGQAFEETLSPSYRLGFVFEFMN